MRPIHRTKIMGQAVSIYRRFTRDVTRGGSVLGHVKQWGRDKSGEQKWIIDLSPDLEPGSLDEFITIIHELMHVADWGRDEIFIDQTSEDIAKTLWKMGYRVQDAPQRRHRCRHAL